MAKCHLRIYYGPDSQTVVPTASSSRRGREESSVYPQRVTLPLKEVLGTLAEAVQRGRGWVQDFSEDEVSISTDLYEVILAYQHYHRPSA